MKFDLKYTDEKTTHFELNDPSFEQLKDVISKITGITLESLVISYNKLNGENATLKGAEDFVDCALEFSYSPQNPISQTASAKVKEIEDFLCISFDEVSVEHKGGISGFSTKKNSLVDQNEEKQNVSVFSTKKNSLANQDDLDKDPGEDQPCELESPMFKGQGGQLPETESFLPDQELENAGGIQKNSDSELLPGNDKFKHQENIPTAMTFGAQGKKIIIDTVKSPTRDQEKNGDDKLTPLGKKDQFDQDLYKTQMMSEESFSNIFGFRPSKENLDEDNMYSCAGDEDDKKLEKPEDKLGESMEQQTMLAQEKNIDKQRNRIRFLSTNESCTTNTNTCEYISEVHHDVICNNCRVVPIVGTRFKCLQCVDFDLCSQCEATHHKHHVMLRIPKRGMNIDDKELLQENLKLK